jgi:hypothetical protein
MRAVASEVQRFLDLNEGLGIFLHMHWEAIYSTLKLNTKCTVFFSISSYTTATILNFRGVLSSGKRSIGPDNAISRVAEKFGNRIPSLDS